MSLSRSGKPCLFFFCSLLLMLALAGIAWADGSVVDGIDDLFGTFGAGRQTPQRPEASGGDSSMQDILESIEAQKLAIAEQKRIEAERKRLEAIRKAEEEARQKQLAELRRKELELQKEREREERERKRQEELEKEKLARMQRELEEAQRDFDEDDYDDDDDGGGMDWVGLAEHAINSFGQMYQEVQAEQQRTDRIIAEARRAHAEQQAEARRRYDQQQAEYQRKLAQQQKEQARRERERQERIKQLAAQRKALETRAAPKGLIAPQYPVGQLSSATFDPSTQIKPLNQRGGSGTSGTGRQESPAMKAWRADQERRKVEAKKDCQKRNYVWDEQTGCQYGVFRGQAANSSSSPGGSSSDGSSGNSRGGSSGGSSSGGSSGNSRGGSSGGTSSGGSSRGTAPVAKLEVVGRAALDSHPNEWGRFSVLEPRLLKAQTKCNTSRAFGDKYFEDWALRFSNLSTSGICVKYDISDGGFGEENVKIPAGGQKRVNSNYRAEENQNRCKGSIEFEYTIVPMEDCW